MLTGQLVALHHLGARLNQRLELLDDLGVVLLQPNLAPQAGVEPELAPVEHRHVTLDQPGLLQFLTLRQHGETERPTRSASPWLLIREFCCSSARIWRWIRSSFMATIGGGNCNSISQKAPPGKKIARSRQRRHAALPAPDHCVPPA